MVMGLCIYQSLKVSPGSREFDVLNLLSGGEFDKGGEFEFKSRICTFLPVSSLKLVIILKC